MKKTKTAFKAVKAPEGYLKTDISLSEDPEDPIDIPIDDPDLIAFEDPFESLWDDEPPSGEGP